MTYESHRFKCPICRTPRRTQEQADACERSHTISEVGP